MRCNRTGMSKLWRELAEVIKLEILCGNLSTKCLKVSIRPFLTNIDMISPLMNFSSSVRFWGGGGDGDGGDGLGVVGWPLVLVPFLFILFP